MVIRSLCRHHLNQTGVVLMINDSVRNELSESLFNQGSQFNNNQSKLDPWSHIPGDRSLVHNPWRGKYDRRSKPRNIEEWIDYHV